MLKTVKVFIFFIFGLILLFGGIYLGNRLTKTKEGLSQSPQGSTSPVFTPPLAITNPAVYNFDIVYFINAIIKSVHTDGAQTTIILNDPTGKLLGTFPLSDKLVVSKSTPASKLTIKDLKPGQHIQANLRYLYTNGSPSETNIFYIFIKNE